MAVEDPLTLEEIHALLWVVRNVDSDALRSGPYRPQEGVTGHGDLSTATNKIEWQGTVLATPPCEARIYHGPGHQSSTRCRVKGPHEIHEARYGSDDQLGRWKDGQWEGHEPHAITGYFNEPPTDPEDEDES